MNKLATLWTTVNAPYSKKLTAGELAACLHDVEAAKKAAGPVSAFLGEVSLGLQVAFAQRARHRERRPRSLCKSLFRMVW